MRCIVVMLLIAAVPVHAQVLYKCVGKGGSTSYQSEPCAPSAKVAKLYDATPEPYSPEHEARLRQQRANQNRAARELSRMAGTDQTTQSTVYQSRTESPRDSQRRNCADAKFYREETLKRVGLSRTYELLQQLDRAVYDACKGL